MKKILFKILPIFIVIVLCSSAGYVGELPKLDIQAEKFEVPSQTVQELPKIPGEMPKIPEEKSPPKTVQPLAPRNYPDIYSSTMVKQGKYTKYLKDLDDLIPVLEKLKQTIQDKGDLQMFCANTNVLNLYATDLENTYKSKPERFYQSYKQILKTNKTVQEAASYWIDTKKYRRIRWNPYGKRISDEEFVNQKLQSALKSINIALEILKEI